MTQSLAPDVVIRPALSSDVPVITDHVRRVLGEFGISFGIGATSDSELFELPDSYLRREGLFWIAERAGSRTLLGTAGIVRVRPDAFELRKMYLVPESRGHGIGAALLDLAVAHARQRGAAKLVLDTVDQMREAIAFYERRGFVRDDSEISAPRCTRGYMLPLD
jgi:putative acetyltransferase